MDGVQLSVSDVAIAYSRLSWGNAAGAGNIVIAGLQTLGGDFQANKTELDFAVGTKDVLTLFSIVLDQKATSGTGTDRGAAADPPDV